MKNYQRSQFISHVSFWVLYYLFSVFIDGGYDSIYDRAFISHGILLPVKLAFCYSVLFFLLPKYLNYKRYFLFTIYLALFLCISVIIYRTIFGFIILPYYYPERPFTPYDIGRFLWGIFDVIFPSAILLAIELFKAKHEGITREQELLNEKLKTELSFLKSQTSPHFLFNTLNNIYGLSLAGSPKTPEVILKLSDLLRFILKHASAKSISLIEELKMLDNYIALEKLRYGDRLRLSFIKNPESPTLEISPLLLLTLVENSFKHGASESISDPFINILLVTKHNELFFKIENSFEAAQNNKSEGIGLKNLKRQLELTYPEQFKLDIDAGKDFYTVCLQINFE